MSRKLFLCRLRSERVALCFHGLRANASAVEPVHFLQIWILPDEAGITPEDEQRRSALADAKGKLVVVPPRGGVDGSVTVHAGATIYAGVFAGGDRATFEVPAGRRAWSTSPEAA